MAWREKAEGTGLWEGWECVEPPCMEGREDGGAWGGRRKKNRYTNQIFFVLL